MMRDDVQIVLNKEILLSKEGLCTESYAATQADADTPTLPSALSIRVIEVPKPTLQVANINIVTKQQLDEDERLKNYIKSGETQLQESKNSKGKR